jgi:hypothetical protein
MEVSLTQIFDRPVRGREFFEEILRDHLDLGRVCSQNLIIPSNQELSLEAVRR